jgi:hypothetical protein
VYIGVYIADIIITTTVTITVIEATITAITAIGETYRVAAVSKLALQRSSVPLGWWRKPRLAAKIWPGLLLFGTWAAEAR